MEFTYKGYENLISLLINHHYEIADYHDYDQFERCVILRHDVDFSLEKALKFAEIEKALSVRSTYFMLLSTDFYNVASAKSLGIIERIIKCDHEIGLHFDEIKYKDNVRDHVIAEADILKAILSNYPIRTVTMHRPSKSTLAAGYDFGDIVNCYGEVFFHDFKYISDSRKHWREDADLVITSDRFNRLHILTHPFWYDNEELILRQSIVNFLDSAEDGRKDSLRDNIRDFEEIMESR